MWLILLLLNGTDENPNPLNTVRSEHIKQFATDTEIHYFENDCLTWFWYLFDGNIIFLSKLEQSVLSRFKLKSLKFKKLIKFLNQIEIRKD